MSSGLGNAKFKKNSWLSLGVLVLIGLVGGGGGCVSVGSGSLGVLWTAHQGTHQEPYPEGRYSLIYPNKMYIYDIRSLTHDEILRVLANDGLLLNMNATVRYHVVRQEVVALHEQIGLNYYDKIIGPVIRSEARRIMSRYTPEEIYTTKREEIEHETAAGVAAKIQGKHLEVEAVLIRNVELPATLRVALEQRAVAEQEVLKTRSMLQIAKAAAEQRRVEAQGIADFNRAISSSLNGSVLEYDRIQQISRLAASPNAKTVIMGAGPGGHAPGVLVTTPGSP